MMGLSKATRDIIRKEINIYEAVEAHLAWKMRLDDYLNGRLNEELQPHVICMDNRCTLGQWLHGHGKELLHEYVLFQQLVEEHAKFHFHASKVVEAHQAGNTGLATQLLAGDFSRQSNKTVVCLTKLNHQIEGAEAAV